MDKAKKDLLLKAEQFLKENDVMIDGADGHNSWYYYKGAKIGMERIIGLIKRQL